MLLRKPVNKMFKRLYFNKEILMRKKKIYSDGCFQNGKVDILCNLALSNLFKESKG